jgi:hypothetical protein
MKSKTKKFLYSFCPLLVTQHSLTEKQTQYISHAHHHTVSTN